MKKTLTTLLCGVLGIIAVFGAACSGGNLGGTGGGGHTGGNGDGYFDDDFPPLI